MNLYSPFNAWKSAAMLQESTNDIGPVWKCQAFKLLRKH